MTQRLNPRTRILIAIAVFIVAVVGGVALQLTSSHGSVQKIDTIIPQWTHCDAVWPSTTEADCPTTTTQAPPTTVATSSTVVTPDTQLVTTTTMPATTTTVCIQNDAWQTPCSFGPHPTTPVPTGPTTTRCVPTSEDLAAGDQYCNGPRFTVPTTVVDATTSVPGTAVVHDSPPAPNFGPPRTGKPLLPPTG